MARLNRGALHRVMRFRVRYVNLAVAPQGLSGVTSPILDETSRARGRDDVTVAADRPRRAVIVGAGSATCGLSGLSREIRVHGGDPETSVRSRSAPSPAFTKGGLSRVMWGVRARLTLESRAYLRSGRSRHEASSGGRRSPGASAPIPAVGKPGEDPSGIHVAVGVPKVPLKG